MMKINKTDIGIEIHEKTLKNGLKVFIAPMKYNQKYVTFSTNYGSIENTFIPHGESEFVRVNDGIAHFLEHKMFEQKNGEDVFKKFAQNGVKPNANTSYTKTTYLFTGVDNFNDSLNYLIDYVQEPYFTDENVNKEKGIIEQEIKMYDDMPWNILFEKTMENLFINSPYKIPIIGNIKSIYDLTKEDLNLCYKTFYHPSNMFIVVTGDVDPVEVFDLIENNQSKKDYRNESKIVVKEIIEPDHVCTEYEEVTMNQVVPKLNVAFKVNTKEFDKRKANVFSNIFLNILFGSTSDFYEHAMKEELFITNFMETSFDADSHIIYFIEAESKKADQLIKEIIEKINKKEINKEDFELFKKSMISSYILSGESIHKVNSAIMTMINKYGYIDCNYIKYVNDLSFEEFSAFVDKIDLSNYSTLIVK